MKILTIGFIVFVLWSALSTYLYVCKIKGLCNEPAALEVAAGAPGNATTLDTIIKPAVKQQALIPADLILYFNFDKAEFIFDSAIDKYADMTKGYLGDNNEAMVRITGHTDAIGSEEYNQALGYRRAKSVEQYFADKGILPNKIIIESKGEKEPVADNNTKEGRSKNRRATITIQK